MFVLDTNIVSELRKVRSGKANPGVASWAEQVPSAELFMTRGLKDFQRFDELDVVNPWS